MLARFIIFLSFLIHFCFLHQVSSCSFVIPQIARVTRRYHRRLFHSVHHFKLYLFFWANQKLIKLCRHPDFLITPACAHHVAS